MPTARQSPPSQPSFWKRYGLWLNGALAALLALLTVELLLAPLAEERLAEVWPKITAARCQYATANVSFFKNFPYLTLELLDFSIETDSARQKKWSLRRPVLAEAARVSALFSPLDGLGGEWKILKLRIETANIVATRNEKERWNWQEIFPEKKRRKNKVGLLDDLANVEVADAQIWVWDEENYLSAQVTQANGVLNGLLFDPVFDCETKANGRLTLYRNGVLWAKDKPVALQTRLAIDKELQEWTVAQCAVDWAGFEAEATGKLTFQQPQPFMDLALTFPRLDLKKALGLTPALRTDRLNDFSAQGLLALGATVRGVWSATQTPYFHAHLKAENAALTFAPDKRNLIDSLFVEIDWLFQPDDLSRSHVKIERLTGRTGGKPFYLRYEQRFANPYIAVEGRLATSLADWQPLWQAVYVGGSLDGSLEAQASAQLYPNEWVDNPWKQSQAQGRLTMELQYATDSAAQTSKGQISALSLRIDQQKAQLHAGALNGFSGQWALDSLQFVCEDWPNLLAETNKPTLAKGQVWGKRADVSQTAFFNFLPQGFIARFSAQLGELKTADSLYAPFRGGVALQLGSAAVKP